MNNEIKSNFNSLFDSKAQIVIDKVLTNNKKDLFCLKKVLTSGHGYYVIEQDNKLYSQAKNFCEQNKSKSYNEQFCFLEEDSEIYEFVNSL
jgi:ribosomal protein L24E